MLKKIVRFILLPVFILSLIGAVYYAAKDIKVRNWYKTTLTVTFIGLPEGNVFGDYTDAHGVRHQNEPAFVNSAFSGYKTDVKQYYGSTFTILNDPETGVNLNYDGLIKNNIICFGLTSLSGAILFLTRKHREQA